MIVEALTGVRPFTGKTYPELVRSTLDTTYHLPGATGPWRTLDDLLQRTLAKDPQHRFASAATVRDLLIPAIRACGG